LAATFKSGQEMVLEGFVIRRLRGADAMAFRELRLNALQAHPEAFGASWEEEQAQPEARFAERLENGHVIGGISSAQTLAGIAGMSRFSGQKTRHIGSIWGMYVRPETRRKGLAQLLLKAAIEEAGTSLRSLRLSVESKNHAAIRLYEAAGFVRWALEIDALKVGDVFHDEILMRLELR
jgi:ribosomal protein S18 acetylase RimI-like enzyme